MSGTKSGSKGKSKKSKKTQDKNQPPKRRSKEFLTPKAPQIQAPSLKDQIESSPLSAGQSLPLSSGQSAPLSSGQSSLLSAGLLLFESSKKSEGSSIQNSNLVSLIRKMDEMKSEKNSSILDPKTASNYNNQKINDQRFTP